MWKAVSDICNVTIILPFVEVAAEYTVKIHKVFTLDITVVWHCDHRVHQEVRKFNEAVRKITEAVILPEKNESWQ